MGRETGGVVLTITGLKNFYFLPKMTDMRCGYHRIMEIIKVRYGRQPNEGDVYFYMSKDRRKVRMAYFERHSFNLYTKTFEPGYKFMKLEYENDKITYKVQWSDLVAVLENPVIKGLRIDF